MKCSAEKIFEEMQGKRKTAKTLVDVDGSLDVTLYIRKSMRAGLLGLFPRGLLFGAFVRVVRVRRGETRETAGARKAPSLPCYHVWALCGLTSGQKKETSRRKSLSLPYTRAVNGVGERLG